MPLDASQPIFGARQVGRPRWSALACVQQEYCLILFSLGVEVFKMRIVYHDGGSAAA